MKRGIMPTFCRANSITMVTMVTLIAADKLKVDSVAPMNFHLFVLPYLFFCFGVKQSRIFAPVDTERGLDLYFLSWCKIAQRINEFFPFIPPNLTLPK